MNVLFSDKTGTITQGNLSLVEFITGNGEIVDSIQSREFIEAITLNNLAKFSQKERQSEVTTWAQSTALLCH